MRSHSELEKLTFVAQAAQSESSIPRLRAVFPIASVVLVAIALVAEASPLENAAVRVAAALVVVATVLVFARWRYSPVLVGLFYIPMVVDVVFLQRHKGIIDWAFAAIFAACCAVLLRTYARLTRAIWLAGKPECAAERENVAQWIARLRAPYPEHDVVQFAAGDFWSNGRQIVRVLRDGRWVVAGSFYRQNLRNTPALAVAEVSAGSIEYSPDRRRLRIGRSKFRKIEFTRESTMANQLIQIVSAS